jgi:hypothetical protein
LHCIVLFSHLEVLVENLQLLHRAVVFGAEVLEKLLTLVFLGAALTHVIYMIRPPDYYIAMHNNSISAARWVSVFAVPILIGFHLASQGLIDRMKASRTLQR